MLLEPLGKVHNDNSRDINDHRVFSYNSFYTLDLREWDTDRKYAVGGFQTTGLLPFLFI